MDSLLCGRVHYSVDDNYPDSCIKEKWNPIVEIETLKLLIALNGHQRLPHYESDIFRDTALAELYLNNLCQEMPDVLSGLNKHKVPFLYKLVK
jgi:hypothetical protein